MLNKSRIGSTAWAPNSWQQFPAFQQPQYHDLKLYQRVLQKIRSSPPLVFPGEVRKLKDEVARAGRGESFILQGGNCAERFIDCNAESITNQIKILLQMSVILTYGARKPVVRIGRIAGQYAKPRSRTTETHEGREIPSYFGDSVNEYEATLKGRTPNPQRLQLCYHYSAATLNYIRSMIGGGFADLHHPYAWNLHSIEQTPNWPEYQELLDRILDAINFMESFGGADKASLGQIDFYTSHEGLLLDYEEALTRQAANSEDYYNLGAHMLWIGERSRQLDGAHVEYFRGIRNPIGIKLGPAANPDEVMSLLAVLNPDDEPGRIMLISRIGVAQVQEILPRLVRAVRHSGRTVTWCCDPMHGNTTGGGKQLKTRRFEDILEELKQTFRIHKKNETFLGGVHFELTGEDVAECVGGAVDLTRADLARNYASYCDPRLNYAQSLEMAFLISNFLRRE